MSLSCNYAVPFVSYLDHALADVNDTIASQTDGDMEQLDPGEIAGLILFLRNYGVATENAHVELSTLDPHVVVHNSIADFGSLSTGGIADNHDFPFVIEALPDAPLGHMVNMTVLVTHDDTQSESHFPLCIGPRHFLVWDPTPDASSGPVIYLTLRGLGYSGRYATNLSAQGLADCQTLWASLGVSPLNHLVLSESDEAQAIDAFLDRGASAYLEGGDVWYHDPAIGGYDFGPLFNLWSYFDGAGSMYQVVGQPGSFAEGILMSHHGETNSIDRLTTSGTGFYLMHNNAPTYQVMIGNDSGASRTIGSSIEFASMRDNTYPSTKAALARRMMFFFLRLDGPQFVPEQPPADALPRVVLTPNPCAGSTLLSCRVPHDGLDRLDLYDAGGRRLRVLLRGPLAPGVHRLRLDVGGLAPGCYFVGTPDAPRGDGSKLLILR